MAKRLVAGTDDVLLQAGQLEANVPVEVNVPAPGDVGLTVKLVATATGNALEIQDSGANVLVGIEPDGEIYINVDSKAIKFGGGKDASILYDGTDLRVSPDDAGTGKVIIDTAQAAALEIGNGAAGVDYQVTINGQDSDGQVTWMEDEDYFDVADDTRFSDRFVCNTATLSAVGPTDNQDAAGINVLLIDASGNNVTLGGFVNGVSGQIMHIVVVGINAATTVTVEHAEGTTNQDIYLTTGADESLANSYGGWTLVCNGTHWYSSEQ